MDNNIFDFGKSELTHDAIISWIINGFNFKESEEDFYYFSRKFIELLDNSLDLNAYNKVKVINQYSIKIKLENDILDVDGNNKRGKLDILAIFSNDGKENYYLVIEDKIFSGESGNQFSEYHKAVIEDLYIREENFRFVNIIIGNFSKYYENKVRSNYWRIITRNDILKTLLGSMTSNKPEFGLLNYYKDYLDKLNKEYLSYESNIYFKTWTKITIFGFFSDLVQKYPNSDFGFVNNRNRGFCGLWFNKSQFISKDGLKYNIYQQLEFKPYIVHDDNLKIKSKEKLDWFIRIKLEDVIFDDNSKSFAKEIRTNKLDKIDREYRDMNYHPGKYLTICSKQIKSINLDCLRDDIARYINIFNVFIEDIGKVIEE